MGVVCACACIPLFCSGVITILDSSMTEFIAVANRSHTIFKQCSGTKKISYLINLAAPHPS
jgi:hypothetical protein